MEWKQTDGRIDATDCFTFSDNAVGYEFFFGP